METRRHVESTGGAELTALVEKAMASRSVEKAGGRRGGERGVVGGR